MAKVVISINDPGFLLGFKGLEFLLDDVLREHMKFGEKKEIITTAGKHEAKMVLHGAANRTSNSLSFSIAEDQTVCLEGKYSRLWGNIKLSLKGRRQ